MLSELYHGKILALRGAFISIKFVFQSDKKLRSIFVQKDINVYTELGTNRINSIRINDKFWKNVSMETRFKMHASIIGWIWCFINCAKQCPPCDKVYSDSNFQIQSINWETSMADGKCKHRNYLQSTMICWLNIVYTKLRCWLFFRIIDH